MPSSLSRARAALRILVASAAVAASAPPALAGPSEEVLVRLRHPDGHEESLRVSDFRFIYYDRRYVRRSPGLGEKPTLSVKDRARQTRFIQNDEFKKLKFFKLRRLTLEYRDRGEGRSLVLVAIRKKGDNAVWPVILLRNAAIAALPHFRGTVGGREQDFPMPPLVESERPSHPVVVAVDFEPPGQPPRRKRF